MGSDRYLPFLPIILNWIQQALDAHARERRAVSSFNFTPLPRYFSEGLLNTATVVPTDDRLPVPPLSALGLPEFADFENQLLSGITCHDTYFLERSVVADESLHFHELVHVVQWQVLGPKDFLLLYAAGLVESGYRDCPLEAMAFDHQRRFDAGDLPYLVEAQVRAQTLALSL